MTSAATVDLICPCCDESFEGHILMSTNTFGGQTTDFHPLAVGFEPLHFMISTCPKCGYTSYTTLWQSSASLPPEIRDKVRAEITPLLGDKPPDDALRYRFLAQIAEWEGQEARFIGDQYLRAAWCATEMAQRDDEVLCRRRAIEFFQEALRDPALPHEDRQTLVYLVGELYRRIGERERANEWFDRVIAAARPADKPQIAQAARQQRSNPKEFFRDFAK